MFESIANDVGQLETDHLPQSVDIEEGIIFVGDE
jgi:hypothetical protein